MVLGLLEVLVPYRPALLAPRALLALTLVGTRYLWVEKRLPMGSAVGE